MKKVAVIGHFGWNHVYLDGQTVKTKVLSRELCNRFGEDNVLMMDTHGGVKTLLKAPLYTWRALSLSKNVIILPAHNGLRVFGLLLPVFKCFFKDRKIHYSVIGGWLPKMLESKKMLRRFLQLFDSIIVETNTMKFALESQGFRNIYVMPNFKELKCLTNENLIYSQKPPYKLCTFSRVMKEKGIEDAVNAVRALNMQFGETIYTLDIYGQVDSGQVEWFEKLQAGFPEYIHYGGMVPFEKSVDVLKDYFALLFPTHFFTEGVPGTIIDGYAAGVPVIGAKWQSFGDIVENGMTGIGYEFGNADALRDTLLQITRNIDEFNAMKIKCLKKSRCYTPGEAIRVILDLLV